MKIIFYHKIYLCLDFFSEKNAMNGIVHQHSVFT